MYAANLGGGLPLRAVERGRCSLTSVVHEEAQENVAIDVAEQIRDVLLGLPAAAVNIPGLSAESWSG